MAGYHALYSYPSVQVTSGSQVENVEVVTCATLPTGVQFTFAIPSATWVNDDANVTLTGMADYLETLVSDHHVTSGSPSQDFDANNLLRDFVDLIVTLDRSATGEAPLTGLVSVAITNIFLAAAGSAAQGFGGGAGYQDPALLCDDEYARLVALGGG